jgi:hypothetical protein
MKLRPAITSILICGTLICPQHAWADDTSADAAAASGLAYLAKQQNADGSFEADGPRVASTGLCLLAFLSTGNTSDGGRYAPTVRRAIDSLLRQSPADHDFGRIDASHMRGHAIVTLALCQAYGVEPDEQTRARIRAVAKDATAVLVSTQRDGAWGEARGAKTVDPVTTEWCLEALRAAQQINLHVSKENLDRGAAYLAQHPSAKPPTTQRLIQVQLPDGSWPADASTQPASDVETTALNIITLSMPLHLMPAQ